MHILPQAIRNWSIYKITNPEGRVYIGCTSKIDQRKKHQLNNSSDSTASNRNQDLNYSIKKYGGQSHSFEVIETFESSRLYAEGKEIFWIRSYMSNSNKWPEIKGFNLTDGGVGLKGYKPTPQTRAKMSVSGAKKIFTKKHKENIIKGLKIPILQFDLNGKYLREFHSIQEASIFLSGPKAKGGGRISEVCQGKLKSTRGFIFKYKQ